MSSTYPHHVLIVASVSSPAQAGRRARDTDEDTPEDKYSLDNQLATCREHLARHPAWRAVGEVVIPGHTRWCEMLHELTADCPEYASFITHVRDGTCTLVMVSVDDRLYHTMELALQVKSVFRAHRVQLYDCSRPREPVRPDELEVTAIDKLMDAISGYATERDIETRVAKTYPGRLSRIRQKGLPISSRAPYGYQRDGKNAPPIQIPDEVHWLRWMRERRVEWTGFGRISQQLNEMGTRTHQGKQWSPTSVQYVLTNPFYAGWVKYGPAQAMGIHEPVFTPAEWAELQEVNRILAERHMPSHTLHEFTGLCKCAVCRRGMVYWSPPPKKRMPVQLICGSYNEYTDGREHDIPRHRNAHAEPALQAQVITQLQVELNDIEAFITMRQRQIGQRQERSLEAITAEIRKRDIERQRWNDAYEHGVIDVAELYEHRRRLDTTLRELEAEQRRVDKLQALRQGVKDQIEDLAADQGELTKLLKSLPEFAWEDRRRVYLRLFHHIWLSPDRPITADDIEWR